MQRHMTALAPSMALAWALATAAGAALGMPSPAMAGQAPAAEAPKGDAKRGADLYVRYGCWQCHGRAAQGGAAGPRIGPDVLPLPAFTRYTRTPRSEMPPYTTRVLTVAELQDIYVFVSALPAPSGRPALLAKP